jgi:hypothetical protein
MRSQEIPIEKDILWGDDESRQMHYTDLSLMSKVLPGKTTEVELYEIHGKKINIRMSFNPVFPAEYWNSYRPIDKIIIYEGGKSNKVEEPGIVTYNTIENLVTKYYLYKGIVQFFSIGRLRNDPDKWRAVGESTREINKCFNDAKIAGICEIATCESKFYELKVLGWKVEQHLNGHYISGHKKVCYWEKPDFEMKLKKSGYYELMKDPHYGSKLACCK